MEHLFTSESIISFIILVVLEVVLGIDNVIFVSIIMNRLNDKRPKKSSSYMDDHRYYFKKFITDGIWLAISPKRKIYIPESWFGKGFDLASIVMLVGGLFLIYKSVKEIHRKLEGEDPNVALQKRKGISLAQAIAQIMLIDAVFSFDSIITAGGTAKHVEIMIAAVVIAMIVMFTFSPAISSFIHKHPTLKMLAFSFLGDDRFKPCDRRMGS